MTIRDTTEVDFRALFENAPGLYLILLPDKKFTIVAVSNAYAAATMTERNDILGKGLFEVFPDNPGDPQADGVSNLRTSLNTVLKTKQAHTMETQKYDIRRPDGNFEERHWSPLNTPVLNKAKEITYIIHRVEDVTRMVHMERDKKKNSALADDMQRRFSTVFYKSPVMKAITDAATGKFIEVNDNFVDFCGFKREEVIGKTSLELNLIPDPAHREAVIRMIKEKGYSNDVVMEIRSRDGKTRWVSTSSHLVNLDGKDCFITAMINITRRKQAEEQILKINAGLEQTVAERTREVMERSKYVEKRASEMHSILLRYAVMDFSREMPLGGTGDEWDSIAAGLNTLKDELQRHILQVQESNRQLEAANKELEAFTYSVSHDLRAPLRAIDGFTKILADDYIAQMDAEAGRLMHIVMGNAQKMGQLIDDLLTFSRLGRKELVKVNLNMKDLTESVLNEFKSGLNGNVTMEVRPLAPVPGDNTLIRQVLVNLISNAIKYSRTKPTPKIEIGSQEEGDKVTYYVKDNGVGFDMQYAHKLFGVFQRLHSANEFEGTGVGLAIVQRVVSKHGGQVWAEGKLNEGASFYFSLPAAQAGSPLQKTATER